MSISVDVKALGEDIISSYQGRIGTITRLKKDTDRLKKDANNLLKGFRSDRNEMAIKDKNQRLKEVKSLANATGSLLKGFRSERIGMDANLHKTLNKAVAEIRRDTRSLLNDCAAERNKMAANWQEAVTTMAKKRGVSPVAKVSTEANPVERGGSKKVNKRKNKKGE